jgi:hypothetical protein
MVQKFALLSPLQTQDAFLREGADACHSGNISRLFP